MLKAMGLFVAVVVGLLVWPLAGDGQGSDQKQRELALDLVEAVEAAGELGAQREALGGYPADVAAAYAEAREEIAALREAVANRDRAEGHRRFARAMARLLVVRAWTVEAYRAQGAPTDSEARRERRRKRLMGRMQLLEGRASDDALPVDFAATHAAAAEAEAMRTAPAASAKQALDAFGSEVVALEAAVIEAEGEARAAAEVSP